MASGLLGLLFSPPTAAEEPVAPAPLTRLALTLEPRLPGSTVSQISGELELRLHREESEVTRVRVSEGVVEPIVLPAGRQWLVTGKLPGYWLFPEVLNLRQRETERRQALSVWPTGVIAGTLKLGDKDDLLPTSLTARMEPPPHVAPSKKVPWGEVRCPVDPRGRFTCDLPAETLDLALLVPGFVPHYRWGYRLVPGKRQALGTLELRRGASVAGFVVTSAGGLNASASLVTLEPILPQGGAADVAVKLQRLARRERIDERGFFQFADLAAGLYRLRVEHLGFAPSEAGPIEVKDRSETWIREPIEMRLPMSLQLTITPPLDWAGRPWRVRMGERSSVGVGSAGDPPYEGTAAQDGRLTIPDRTPGPYELRVYDSQGNAFFRDLNPIPLDAATAERFIDIPLVEVEGRVTVGKEPLAATVWFGGRYGSESSRMEANEDGEFEGTLPRGGIWFVELIGVAGEALASRKVKVEPNERGEATVDLHLADTQVFGRVVDESGSPVAGAAVTVGARNAPRYVWSAEDGKFSARGFDAGVVQLSAEHSVQGRRLRSDGVVVTSAEENPTGPVELRLQGTKQLTGRVVGPAGPVLGAALTIWPRNPAAMGAEPAGAGIDGTFSAEVPSKTTRVLVWVEAPGYPFQGIEQAVSSEPLVLTLATEGGDLHLRWPMPLEEMDLVRPWPLVFRDGTDLGTGALMHHLTRSGQPLPAPDSSEITFHDMAVGEYTLCLADEATLIARHLAESHAPAGGCVSGTLTPGGTLTLDLRLP